jgi:hypothetical protein
VATEEIPRARWPAFFHELSERHRRVPISMHTFEPTMRGEAASQEGAFEGAAVQDGKVSLLLADRSGHRVSRRFEAARVWQEFAAEGAEEIEIDAADGSRTMLDFLPAASGPRP